MDAGISEVAEYCLRAAESNSLSFPEIVGKLMQAGFESYSIDFRRATATYYLPDGESVVLATHRHHTPIAAALNVAALRAAIEEAQHSASGYTYLGFCEKVMTGGCAGYLVSFSGRRAVYFGRTAETHVEPFPQR
jgi:uncharacterized protein YbcV (DUF1398 family)